MAVKRVKDLPELCTPQDIADLNPRLWNTSKVTRMCRKGTIEAIKIEQKWAIPRRPFLKKFGLMEVRVVRRKKNDGK